MELISINSLIEIFNVYKNLIFWFGSISLFVFIFSLISIKWLVALIPEDYFINKKDSKIKNNNLIAWYFILILRNLVGYSLNFWWHYDAHTSWPRSIYNYYWINA